jgi:hypothetical protein
MANGMFNKKMDIDRYGPRLIPNIPQNLEPLISRYQLLLKTRKKERFVELSKNYVIALF